MSPTSLRSSLDAIGDAIPPKVNIVPKVNIGRSPIVIAMTVLVVAFFSGCGGGKATTVSNLLASGTIGPGGGIVIVDDPASPFVGTAVEVPPGALASPTEVAIVLSREPGSPEFLYRFSLLPAGQIFAVPVRLLLKYSDLLLSAFYVEDPLALLVASVQAGGEPEVLVPDAVHTASRLVEVKTTHFSHWFVTPESLWMLVYQPRRLSTVFFPFRTPSQSSPAPVTIGRGSMASFWSSSSNLVVIHGFASEPFAFQGPTDLVSGLASDYDNVVLFQYPSGWPIASNAAAFRDLILSHAQPGFRTDVVAHSMGGLVARYALERLGSADLQDLVGNLVTIGTPHNGAPLATFLAGLLDADMLGVSVEEWLPGLLDLEPETGVGPGLNREFHDSTTKYYLIAGATGALGDGYVSVESALGQPVLADNEGCAEGHRLFGPSLDFTYSHAHLHEEATENGVRDQIEGWLGFAPWVKHAGDAHEDVGRAVAGYPDGCCVVAGGFHGSANLGGAPLTSRGRSDAFVAKVRRDGGVAWAVGMGGPDYDIAPAIAHRQDGGCLVAGLFRGTAVLGEIGSSPVAFTAGGETDGFIAALDPRGALLWARHLQLNTAGASHGTIALDSFDDGSSVVTGSFNGDARIGKGGPDEVELASEGYADMFIARFSASGDLLWAQRGGGAAGGDGGRSVTSFDDGSFVIAGTFAGTAAFGAGVDVTAAGMGVDLFVARYGADGAPVWVRRGGGLGPDEANAVTSLPDGSCIVAGVFTGDVVLGGSATFDGGANPTLERQRTTGDSGYDAFVLKYNAAGDLAWVTTFGGPLLSPTNFGDVAAGVSADSAGAFFVTGIFTDGATFGKGERNEVTFAAAGREAVFIAAFESGGTVRWVRAFDGDGADWGLGIAALAEGGCVVTGGFSSKAVFDLGGIEPDTRDAEAVGMTDIFWAHLVEPR